MALQNYRTPSVILDSLPAQEGYVLAYIGYLSLEGRISDSSLPQYISAVSRYHKLHRFPSPTLTPLVRSLTHAYARQYQPISRELRVRTGLCATAMRLIVEAGCQTADASDVAACAGVTTAFIFQRRSFSIVKLRGTDVTIYNGGITASVLLPKGRSILRPLRLRYPSSPSLVETATTVSLIERWQNMRPYSISFFDSSHQLQTSTESLNVMFLRALFLVSFLDPLGNFYSSHSPHIGCYNDLYLLQFPREWMMRSLDWETDAMVRVCNDTRIQVTAHSTWFFAHLRPGVY